METMSDMAQFHYKAVDRSGSHVSGMIDAQNRKAAVAVLTEKGQFVLDLGEGGAGVAVASPESRTQGLDLKVPHRAMPFTAARVRTRDVVAMTNQLSTALRAGLPMMACLTLLRDQQKRPGLRKMMDDLVESVSSGQSLSEAMASHGEVFGPLYLSMIRVGETGGILDQTTSQLSQILTREEKLKASLKNAAAYPIFVLCLGMISVMIIVTWVLPGIMSNLDVAQSLLPWPTRILMSFSHLTRGLLTTGQGWLVLGAVVFGVWRLARWTRSAGRVMWDDFKLKIPVLGTVVRTIAVGRFARTLGSLTKGGVTILEALKVVRDTLGNEVLARQIDIVAEEVKRGEPLAKPLDRSGSFPPLLIQVVAVGEQTGRLDELLLNAAETFDEEADSAISRFISIFPPILIVIMAVIVGFIIVATLLPMITMQLQAVG